MKSRIIWLDLAKGIAIILVVFGHSLIDIGLNNHYIYWFHMPAFFILTGMVFTPPNIWKKFKSFLSKRFKQLIIPYISFLVLITMVRYLYLGTQPLNWYINDILHVIAGGQSIPSAAYVTMWFITCLFVSQLLISILFISIRKNLFRILIIICLYLLAHFESYLSTIIEIHIPGNVDVSLLAVSYICIGMLIRHLLQTIEKKLLTTIVTFSLLLSIFTILLAENEYFYYRLDLYQKIYHSIALDFLLPLSFTIVLLGISYLLSKTKVISSILQSIGNSSLVIMYLHIPIKLIIEKFFGNGLNSELTLIAMGILIPWVLYLISDKYRVTRQFLLGKFSNKEQIKSSKIIRTGA
jgi:polysaccharide biosynthesis protein PslL